MAAKKKREFTCDEGDTVIFRGRRSYVKEVVFRGSEKDKEKSEISVCRIMPDNGQVLHRSPRYIGTEWSHE